MMETRLIPRVWRTLLVLVIALLGPALSPAESFKVGFAKRDVTPEKPMPMWGYGARHDRLSTGVLDPLYAKALVIEVGATKLALVGLDIGRSPTAQSMEAIRKGAAERAGVTLMMISGSHTHHGPVLELTDAPGKGRGKFDDAVAYVNELETKIVEAIEEAAGGAREARMGWGSARVNLNRNRHTKIRPKPIDDELSVVRFDDAEGRPLALLVNFAAHPTMLPGVKFEFSADYPGRMMNAVEERLGVNCFFMQGAAGDQSPNTTQETKTIEAFGAALAEEVIRIAESIETKSPEDPSILGMDEQFAFKLRIDLSDPSIVKQYELAFFPELIANVLDELEAGKVTPHLTTVLVNGELALVGGSGEFFCNHAIGLKRRSRAAKTLFFGYCNGHHLYFPTIEAAAEGGYGADASVSWVELGAGEAMIDKALINIYSMMEKSESP